MVKAVHILMHSILQVFGNLAEALRLSAIPYGIQVAATLMLASSMLTDPASAAQQGGIGGLIVVILAVITSLVIAVNWHRFILNNETPGLIPRFHGSEMMAYAGRILLIAVLVFLMMVPVVVLMLAVSGQGTLTLAVAFVIGLVLSIVILRLSVSLPAMALGEQLSLREGWNSMAGEWPTLFAIGALAFGAQFVVSLLVQIFAFSLTLLLVVQLVLNWVSLMVGLSLLTTLYGHYVQGRPLR